MNSQRTTTRHTSASLSSCWSRLSTSNNKKHPQNKPPTVSSASRSGRISNVRIRRNQSSMNSQRTTTTTTHTSGRQPKPVLVNVWIRRNQSSMNSQRITKTTTTTTTTRPTSGSLSPCGSRLSTSNRSNHKAIKRADHAAIDRTARELGPWENGESKPRAVGDFIH